MKHYIQYKVFNEESATTKRRYIFNLSLTSKRIVIQSVLFNFNQCNQNFLNNSTNKSYKRMTTT